MSGSIIPNDGSPSRQEPRVFGLGRLRTVPPFLKNGRDRELSRQLLAWCLSETFRGHNETLH